MVEEIDEEKTVLKWRKFVSDLVIHDDELKNVYTHADVEQIIKDFTIRYKSIILTDVQDTIHLADTGTAKFETPISTWDYFKYNNKWTSRFFKPPRMRTETKSVRIEFEVTPMVLFPHAKIYPEKLGDPVRYYEVKTKTKEE